MKPAPGSGMGTVKLCFWQWFNIIGIRRFGERIYFVRDFTVFKLCLNIKIPSNNHQKNHKNDMYDSLATFYNVIFEQTCMCGLGA